MVFMTNLCEDVQAPFPTSVVTAVVSMVLCFITVPGNILICIAIIKDPYHELSTSFNYFVLQLALSDVIVGIFTEPAFVVWHIREALNYGVMETIWIVHLTYFISCTASLLSLSALTLDRHLEVVSIRRKLSSCAVVRISGMIWLLSLTIPFIYFATGFYLFAFLFANTAVITTFVIVTFSYCRIYFKLRAQVARWRSFCQDHVASKAMAMEKQVTRAFNLILMFFILCLIPSCIMIYIINLCDKCDCIFIHWLRDLQFLLTLVNCSINQFLYAWRMPNFRKAIAAIICGKSAVVNRCAIPLSPIKITISCNQRGRIETLEFASPKKYMYITDTPDDTGDNNDNNNMQQPQNAIHITSV
ncbi:D(5)-like dopamine receptor [Oculina patagonica]